MSDEEHATDLTGVWDGAYWYGAGQDRTRFVATLFETAGSFEGATLEPAPPGIVSVSEIAAHVIGARAEAEVSFVKTYEVKTRQRLSPIAYTGVANAALSVIEGHWRISGPQIVAGGFLMRRISSPGVMASQKIAATAKVLEAVDAGPIAPARRRGKAPIKAD